MTIEICGLPLPFAFFIEVFAVPDRNSLGTHARFIYMQSKSFCLSGGLVFHDSTRECRCVAILLALQLGAAEHMSCCSNRDNFG